MLHSGTPSKAYAIPMHQPPIDASDADAVLQVLRSGALTGDGVASRRLTALAARTLGCTHVFPVTSGTHALELMLRALPVEPGDEVICPSFTFVSVANAILLAGGTPVFADIDPDTLNLDARDASARVTSRTRAIVTAHYGGIGSQLSELATLCETRGIHLLEDAAHALGGRFLGRPLGTLGLAGAFSFHGTKNIVAGEGGMLVTSDADLARRAEVIREKGTDRSRFLRGEVDRYTWQEIGSSFLMSDLLAALVASQWLRLDQITEARRDRFRRYQEAFAPLRARRIVTLPTVPRECDPAYHIYYLIAEDVAAQHRLIAFLRGRGIEASSHFVALHLSPFSQRTLHTRPGMLPVTERLADRLVRLPLSAQLSPADQQTVVDAVLAFFGGTH